MTWAFAKYQGAGNDFILIDDRSRVFPADDCTLIQRLCHRQQGIGADGLILLQPSHRADFRMRIFNPDGQEPAMCGNGIRCLSQFLADLGLMQTTFVIETMAGDYACTLRENAVDVAMKMPVFLHEDIILPFGVAHIVDSGVPHAVIFVDNLAAVDVALEGSRIRHHPLFSPGGVNVNFASLGKEAIHIRTYERGVEQETLACGTGALAVAFVAAKKYFLGYPLRMVPASKDVLEISRLQGSENLILSGPAHKTFEGVIRPLV